MKIVFTSLLLLANLFCYAQNGAPANPYYSGINWNLSGSALKNALAAKITSTHTKSLTYSQTEFALKMIDRDPNDLINVMLIYGFSDAVCNYTNETNFGISANWADHRKRHKAADQPAPVNGIAVTQCVWNREHVYPKSLATPPLSNDFEGAGTDAHNLRTADVERNAIKGSRKFTNGSGNSAVINENWYPGDEWKGDVARMMMYMYLRYPTQCKPINVGTGNVVDTDVEMLQLFLQWNAEDPVSQYEDLRNSYLGNASNTFGQGNRNPFIDNPYLATKIWGGQEAQNRWPQIYLSNKSFDYANAVSIYPNPTTTNSVNISSTLKWDFITVSNLSGQITLEIKNPVFVEGILGVSDLKRGFYFVTLSNNQFSVVKKLIVE